MGNNSIKRSVSIPDDDDTVLQYTFSVMLYSLKVAGRYLSPTVFGWYTVLSLPRWTTLDIAAL